MMVKLVVLGIFKDKPQRVLQIRYPHGSVGEFLGVTN